MLFVNCERAWLALLLFCISNMFMGGHTSGAYTSLLSLAPQYTPTLTSISQAFSMISQLTSPFIVHTLITKVSFIEMLKYRNLQGTAAEWNRMLMFTSILCIGSGVQFLIWGSGYHKEEKGQRKCFYRGDTRICKERRGESSSG